MHTHNWSGSINSNSGLIAHAEPIGGVLAPTSSRAAATPAWLAKELEANAQGYQRRIQVINQTQYNHRHSNSAELPPGAAPPYVPQERGVAAGMVDRERERERLEQQEHERGDLLLPPFAWQSISLRGSPAPSYNQVAPPSPYSPVARPWIDRNVHAPLGDEPGGKGLGLSGGVHVGDARGESGGDGSSIAGNATAMSKAEEAGMTAEETTESAQTKMTSQSEKERLKMTLALVNPDEYIQQQNRQSHQTNVTSPPPSETPQVVSATLSFSTSSTTRLKYLLGDSANPPTPYADSLEIDPRTPMLGKRNQSLGSSLGSGNGGQGEVSLGGRKPSTLATSQLIDVGGTGEVIGAGSPEGMIAGVADKPALGLLSSSPEAKLPPEDALLLSRR